MGRNDRDGSRALDENTAQAMVRLRRELPTASVTTFISEMMRRRLTSFDVILKAPPPTAACTSRGADGQPGRPTCQPQTL
ncbi:hypothetical protein DFAR_2660003 [Desulfarculales bacterium]